MCPIAQATLVFTLVMFTPMSYNNTYHYPWWGNALGLFLAFSSVLMVPLLMFYRLVATPGTLRQVSYTSGCFPFFVHILCCFYRSCLLSFLSYQKLKITTSPAEDLFRAPLRKTLCSEASKEQELCALNATWKTWHSGPEMVWNNINGVLLLSWIKQEGMASESADW